MRNLTTTFLLSQKSSSNPATSRAAITGGAAHPKKRGMIMQEKKCFNCIHRPVCKYFDIQQQGRFPFIDDSHIPAYLEGVARTQAAACAYFKEDVMEDDDDE